MILFSSASLVPPAVSLALALGLTPVVRVLARRWGFVAKPKIDRWHKNPTALLGGVAIWVAVVGTWLVLVPHTKQGWVVVGGASFLFFVGLGLIMQFSTINTTIQHMVSDTIRGGVMAIYTLMFVGMMPLGSFEIGYVAEKLGPLIAIRIGAVVVGIAGIVLFFSLRRFKSSLEIEKHHL